MLAVVLLMLPACGGRHSRQQSDSVAAGTPAVAPADLPGPPAQAGEGAVLMSADEIAVAIDSITAGYDSDWTDLTMQGKLSFTGLPMKVTVKIYMKRGEAVILSARAPLFGEVARVEICPDSIVLINKHSRTYNVQPLAGIAGDPRAYLSDIQDILLGQVAFPGNGRISPRIASMSQWIAMPGSDALIYPGPSLQVKGTEYGFVMNSLIWELKSFVMMIKQAQVVLETKYLYGESGWTLGLEVDVKGRKMEGEVELTYPDYEPSAPLEFTAIGGKYRKVGIKDIMKF